MTDEEKYPKSLRRVRVSFGEKEDEELDLVYKHLDPYDCDVELNHSAFEQAITSIKPEALLQAWMKRFGPRPCYWSTILSLYPWNLHPEYHLSFAETFEERMLGYLLKYHLRVDWKRRELRFKYNPESPIDKWLRRYTSEGDVATNVRTLFTFAMKFVFQNEQGEDDGIWEYIPLELPAPLEVSEVMA